MAVGEGLQRGGEGRQASRRVGHRGQLTRQFGGSVSGAGEHALREFEREAAIGMVVLATVPAVREVGGTGPRTGSGRGCSVAGFGFDVGEDGPGRPRHGSMAEVLLAFDCAGDFGAGLVEVSELSPRVGEVVSRTTIVGEVVGPGKAVCNVAKEIRCLFEPYGVTSAALPLRAGSTGIVAGS